jgi:hypothetical protein
MAGVVGFKAWTPAFAGVTKPVHRRAQYTRVFERCIHNISATPTPPPIPA